MRTDRLDQRLHEVDDLHRRQMATFEAETAAAHADTETVNFDEARRRFMKRGGLGVAALSFGPTVLPVAGLLPAAAAQDGLSDVDIGVFAESVELAAVEAYTAAVDTGLLSQPVIDAGTLFAGHHQEHAASFAGLVGDAATGTPNAALLEVFGPMIAEAADEAALIEIARQLEEGAAATYHFGLGLIQDPAVAAAPAQILPVESMHAVILGEVLGLDIGDYVPSFQNSDAALSPADFPVS